MLAQEPHFGVHCPSISFKWADNLSFFLNRAWLGFSITWTYFLLLNTKVGSLGIQRFNTLFQIMKRPSSLWDGPGKEDAGLGIFENQYDH